MSHRIMVIGLGAIGGSFAAGCTRNGHDVTGIDQRADRVEAALSAGLVSSGATDLPESISSCDVAVLAVPVGAIIKLTGEVLRRLPPGCILLDTGSSKVEIVAAMNEHQGEVQCVGGHPMAGTDQVGPEGWDAGIFTGRTFALCATNSTIAETKQLVEGLVASLGARAHWFAAEEHDRIVATTSHLPILLSIALTRRAGTLLDSEDRLGELVGRQLRAMTRMSDAPPEMLADIIRHNSKLISGALGELTVDAHKMLEAASDASLADEIMDLAATHKRLFKATQGG